MKGFGVRMLVATALACVSAGAPILAGEDSVLAAGDSALAGAEAQRPACYVGVLVSRAAVDVVAKIEGTLETVAVDVGDAITHGQELAVVASPSGAHRLQEQTARLAAARSSLQSAGVAVDHTRREMERRQRAPALFSTEQIEAARFQLEIAELEHERQQATFAESTATRARVASEESRGRLEAPFDGRVSSRYAVPGTALTAGQPILRLVTTARPLVRFAVPARDVEEFAIGARIRAEAVGGEAEAHAIVEAIAPVLDEASQMVFIEAHTEGEAWHDVPVGAVLHVGAAAGDRCRDRPVALLPD